MARQVLENGVILPAEYSDDWYDDMTSNLTKLDDVIGSDSEKLSSADVGAAALSNNYNDLDNLPTIPTVNDATLTIQKNGVDVQTFTANASSNVTANITVPTKTSDLTNDSNFVDTSNSAVSSGITSAKVTSYDSHIADTDIHVTTADKSKWNNGVSQSYVLRYSSSSVTDNSTIVYSTLDNTDNIKSGDKVIDVDGKIFAIASVDTTNQTVTVGSALIDLALDSNVVHTSGNETVGGQKTFANDKMIVGRNTDSFSAIQLVNADVVGDSANGASGVEVYGSSVSTDNKIGALAIGEYSNNGGSHVTIECNRTVSNVKTTNKIRNLIRNDGSKEFSAGVDNDCQLGHPYFRWSAVYGNTYYYGSNNVEFSTKFVTTDTAQTISGSKTFSDNLTIYNSDDTQTPKGLVIRNAQWGMGESGGTTVSNINFLDKNSAIPVSIIASKGLYGQSFLRFSVRTKDSQNTYSEEIYYDIDTSGNVEFRSWHDNITRLGTSTYKWKDVQTYQINGLEPSSLSLPSGRNTRVDISSYFTNLGSGDTNSYSVSANGYIYMQLKDIATVHCFDFESLSTTVADYIQTFSRGNDGLLYVLFPVKKDHVFKSTWYTNSTVTISGAYFIPCQGNV